VEIKPERIIKKKIILDQREFGETKLINIKKDDQIMAEK